MIIKKSDISLGKSQKKYKHRQNDRDNFKYRSKGDEVFSPVEAQAKLQRSHLTEEVVISQSALWINELHSQSTNINLNTSERPNNITCMREVKYIIII